MEKVISLDSVETYNKIYGFETPNNLITVVDLNGTSPSALPDEVTLNYGLYAVFLKQTYCGDITYGRQPYDYQEGTVTSFAPGQVVRVKHVPDFKPNAIGVLFHPDLLHGTSLAREIKRYSFFSYSSREALHLSEEEKKIFCDCLLKIKKEIEAPADKHSKKIICSNIELLLDYCMRFYERQFVTRKEANHDVLQKFEIEMDRYFESMKPAQEGLPSVKYFAEQCFLSPNYFGDLIKKETGRTPQEYIHIKIIELAKTELLGTSRTITEISNRLGFQYSQHFNRFFKRATGKTPGEYRLMH